MTKEDRHIKNFISNSCDVITRHPYIFLFLFFSIGYFLWRYIGFNYLVWDDTASASYNIHVNNFYYSFDNKDFLVNIFKEVFGHIQGDGYRPCMAFIKRIGLAYFRSSTITILPFVIFNAVLFGLFSVIYFRFTLRFVISRMTALFAVFLIVFSTPLLTSGLSVYSGSQCIIPILICSALLCYYNYSERQTKKIFWFTGLLVIMLVGPLFREFIGIVPLLIILLEFQRLRRTSWVMAVAVLLFLHALFPTAIIKWTMFPNLPLIPVFAMGNLGDFMQRGIGHGSFLYALAVTIYDLHWRIFIDILSIYPTTIFVLFFLTWWLKFKHKGKSAIDKNTLFLVIFFLLSFLPFLKIFNEQVHLLYSLVPMSILLVIAVEDLWFMTANSRVFHKALKIIFVIVITVIVVDSTLNIYSVRKVTQDIYEGIFKSANWFVANVPKGTYVITNAHHLEDIRFYSKGHIEPWGAPGGIPDQSRWMYNPSDLQKMLDERAGHNIYFFDVDIKKPVGQRGEERVLFYVRDKNVQMADLGILHKTQSLYPFLDPLKYLIPIKEITWPGPTDLEFDFYRGPSFNNEPFTREVFAQYHLYKVTGDKVIYTAHMQPPMLVEQDYHGFNIVAFEGMMYAIPQPEGAFDLTRVKNKGYSQSFEGNNLDQVKDAINKALGLKTEKTPCLPPRLVEQNYHGFNIVAFEGMMYAIPQPEGAFDLVRVKNKGYSQSFEGNNLDQVKEVINKALGLKTEKTPILPPSLVEQNYHGFNIVAFEGMMYAIPQPEGAFDLTRVKNKGYSQSFEGNNLDQVKEVINKALGLKTEKTPSLPPSLVEQNYHGFNIVAFEGQFYAIPQRDGAFDLERVEKGGYSRSFQGSNVQEVKDAIDKEFNSETSFIKFINRKFTGNL